MQDWQDIANHVFRDTTAEAIETCNPRRHEAKLDTLHAMQSEATSLPADLEVYALVMAELYGTACFSSEVKSDQSTLRVED